jgi:hypothetical protein
LGQKQYELSSHLGNVQATVSDKRYVQKQYLSTTDSLRKGFAVAVRALYDYYPFGMPMKERSTSDTTTQSVYMSQVVYSPQYTKVNNAMSGASITSVNYTGQSASISKVLSSLLPNVPVQMKIDLLYTNKPLYLAIQQGSAASPSVYTNLLYSTTMNSSGTYTISFTPTQSSVQLSIAYSYFNTNANTLCFTLDSVNYQQQSASVSSTQLVQVSNKLNDGYRYGYNSQEKVDEIAGAGNHTTAEFWEYDTRLGRRWNRDPEPTFGISEYAAFNNNPILFADPDGKFPIIPIIAAAAYYVSSKIMEKSEGNDVIRTVGYSMRHPVNAFKTNGPFLTNHNDVATNFQVNIGKALGVKNVEGGVQNAIRHTLWQALLTQDMGAKAASRIGNAHESTTNVDMNQRVFKGVTAKDDADRTIDLLNNQIGRVIGEQNKDADNITTAKAVVTEYFKNGLYAMTGNDKDGYKVQKTKLTKSQYETALKEIDKKGQDGMNKTTDEKK